MCRLMAMDPGRLHVPDGVSEARFRKMLGNSMCVNVLEALFVMINKAAPSVLKAGPLTDRWSSNN